LAKAVAQGASHAVFVDAGTAQAVSMLDWGALFESALEERTFEIASFPVVGFDGAVIHQEVLLRMRAKDGGLMTAGQFMPIAARLGVVSRLDLQALELPVPG
jgi:EAL domain-containing protein (putative c-di-GMP-specific phosphodiesterase class I)